MKKQILTFTLLSALCIILAGWGSTGHYKISTNAALSYNQHMSQFHEWTSGLAAHASDADARKATDPNEGPRHYIDIDNYYEFNVTGRIPQTLDSAIAEHGSDFVYDNGVLPWATLKTYDSLRNCFLRYDWDKALLFAADLGHYVADGHMPMHITRNYNGQFSGNYGIHSRYESTMINSNISQFDYSGDQISVIDDPNNYIFKYLYENYQFVDSILAADDYAKSVNSNTSSTAYKQALWSATENFTIPLFKNASHALAELIYTAWVEAGSPQMNSSSIFDFDSRSNTLLSQNAPNPFSNSTNITFNLKNKEQVSLRVYNSSGSLVSVLIDAPMNQGNHAVNWYSENRKAGLYYLVLNTGNKSEVIKMLRVN